MHPEETCRPARALQPRHIDEVHPVDPLDRQSDVIAENFRHALCYHPPGSARAVLPLQGRLGR
jgi:hypothetical protein